LHVIDAQGMSLQSTVTLTSDANQFNETLRTDIDGILSASQLPFGVYTLVVDHPGFARVAQEIEIRSAIPIHYEISLLSSAAASTVIVQASPTLLDEDQAGMLQHIGRSQIELRNFSLPRRGLVDLVNSQPGWLYEGSGVLHPRGSEYQTQFVVDGVPLTENRSPGSGSQLEPSDLQSMAVYTAGIPAEYGRKLGGVVEVTTLQNPQNGLHGTFVASGGSFSTAVANASVEQTWKKDSAGLTGGGAYTEWFENPPVLQNFTNQATSGEISGRYQHESGNNDSITLTTRHEFARFLVPNEQLQQAGGQLQHRASLETMGTAGWQHVFSPNMLASLVGMVRDDTALLDSNAFSTPIIAGQHRGFREGYLKASGIFQRGRHEWKAGIEGDFLNLHEQFHYNITDPSAFDPGTPPHFDFFQNGKDREQGVFIEDTAHLNHWTLAAGIRWDNYQLIVHRQAFSPRVALSRYFVRLDMVAHFSYDRVCQTPAFENILLSSSPSVVSLNPQVLREPVLPSRGNYYEAGISKRLFSHLRFDGNYFLRQSTNFADDNPLLDTSISFPIAFRKASIYGFESTIAVPHWHVLSGTLSHSYLVGSAYFPVTGGLFLGSEAVDAQQQTQGRFWVSQDQRNTVRTRWIYHLPHGFWLGTGADYGSGLPVEFDGTEQQAIAQYGARLVSRVNFSRGRIKPNLAINANGGYEFAAGDRAKIRIQIDGENLFDRINLIDFAGLFSGNAVAPPRSYGLRFTTEF